MINITIEVFAHPKLFRLKTENFFKGDKLSLCMFDSFIFKKLKISVILKSNLDIIYM